MIRVTAEGVGRLAGNATADPKTAGKVQPGHRGQTGRVPRTLICEDSGVYAAALRRVRAPSAQELCRRGAQDRPCG